MDGRHLGIDLELAHRRENEILGGHAVGSREGIAQEQPLAGSHHYVHDIRAKMNHHLVVLRKRRRCSEHFAKQARIFLLTGIKKNCLVARQFQTFYRVALFKNDYAGEHLLRSLLRKELFRNEGIFQHYSQLPALLFAFSMEPTIRPA